MGELRVDYIEHCFDRSH